MPEHACKSTTLNYRVYPRINSFERYAAGERATTSNATRQRQGHSAWRLPCSSAVRNRYTIVYYIRSSSSSILAY